MLCPACKGMLVILEVEGVELDACPDGHGLWFDAQEVEQLFALAGVPDDVTALVRRLEVLTDRPRTRRCPRCRCWMEAVHAPGQPTIILDRCRKLGGLWFDRGEVMAFLACLLGEDDAPLERVRAFLGRFAEPALEEKGEAS